MSSDVSVLTRSFFPHRVYPPGRARFYGYLAVATAAALFGMWATAGKLALAEVNGLVIAFYTQAIPGLLFLPALLKYGFPRKELRLLLLVALSGTVAAPILYFVGLNETTSANAALLSNTESLFTIAFAFMFLGERLSHRGYLALVGIAVGAFLVATELDFSYVTFERYLLGNLLLISAACLWAVNNNGSAVLGRRARILPFISLQLLLGSAILLPMILVSGTSLVVSGAAAAWLLFLAFFGIATFTVLYYGGLKTIGAMRAGAVLSTSSLWGVLIAIVVFPAQGLGFWQIVGGGLMVGATLALYLFGERVARPATASETLKPAASDGPRLP